MREKDAISLKILGVKEPRPFFTAGTELSTRDWAKMNPKYQGQFLMVINCFRPQMSWVVADITRWIIVGFIYEGYVFERPSFHIHVPSTKLFPYVINTFWKVSGKFSPYLFRDPHAENARHPLDEDIPDPSRHPVCARLPIVEVEHDGGEADGDRDQDHREQEVAAQQRQRERGGGDNLRWRDGERCHNVRLLVCGEIQDQRIISRLTNRWNFSYLWFKSKIPGVENQGC